MRKFIIMTIVAVCLVITLGDTAKATSVTLVATATTADNYYDLYIDGGDGAGGEGPAIHVAANYSGGEWKIAETKSFSLAMGQTHLLAVEAHNWEPYGGYNPAAFIGQLDAGSGNWFLESGNQLLLTSVQWQVWVDPLGLGGAPADQGSLKWYDAGYDDSGWVNAFEIGANGTGPWGTINGISSEAQWIWTENWNDDGLPVGGQDVDTPVYFRMSFTPVPEPMTLAGALMGCGALVGYLRRRRKS